MAEAIASQNAPYKVSVEVGKDYNWCACGRSKTQPFCDGSHKAVGLAPVSFTAEKSGDVWLCGCRKSGKQSFCDGTHKKL